MTSLCHSGEGGNLDAEGEFLDSRLRGNDAVRNQKTNGRAGINS